MRLDPAAQGDAQDLLRHSDVLESSYLGTVDADPDQAAAGPPLGPKESR